MLLQTNFPPDIRVENEILSLSSVDFNIHLLCRNGGNQKKRDLWEGVDVQRLIHPKRFKYLSNLLQLPVFFNPVWIFRSVQIILKEKINTIHVHDLPLAPLALLLKLLFRISIVYDMHENYPAALRAWKKSGSEYWLKHPAVFKRIERMTIPRFDRLIAVVDENRDRIIADYGVPAENVFVVSNYVNLNTFKPDAKYLQIDIPEGVKIFLYTGGLDIHRGIDITFEAFRKLSEDHDDILLLVVGGGKSSAGQKTEQNLRAIVESDNTLRNKVIITGWLDIKYIPWLILKSHYCLIPQGANDHTNTTIPHKLFQYTSFGKPVVAADALPMKRFISEMEAGITFTTGSISSYHSALEDIIKLDYSEVSIQLEAKTREKYSWKCAEKELFELYNSLRD